MTSPKTPRGPATTGTAPADAISVWWLRALPPQALAFAQLARLDRPIGTWLLFWPCIWGMLLKPSQPLNWLHILLLSALFFVGAVAMRGAGCVYNDIIDRNIDAKVARTRGRPLPSGRVSLRGAWIFMFGLCGVGLVILLLLNPFAQKVALASILLVAAYPFMKRITWWPQAWLGLTFNWGVLVGYAADHGTLNLNTFFLYAAGIFWTLGYDTIYALQDIEDDALAGVKSSARALGHNGAKRGVTLFYALSVLSLIAAILLQHGYVSASSIASVTSMAQIIFAVPAFALALLWQLKKLEPTDTANCLLLFRSNHFAGMLLAAGLAAYALFIQMSVIAR